MENEKEFKTALASLAKDKSRRADFAALLVEFIDPGHLQENIMGLFLNTRALKVGDALVKKVRKGIEVHKLIPGSIHLANEITVTDRINYNLDGADVKVNWSQWEMESGELGTVESIRTEMKAKLTDYYVNKTFTALSSIWTASNTPNNFTSVGGALTATALKNMIDYINQRTGKVVAVVGTRKALTPVTTFGAGWSLGGGTEWGLDPALMEIYQTGWLGRYYGAPIVALDQVYNNIEDYQSMIPENKVVVLGQKVGEFITYGDVREKMYDINEPTPPESVLELYQQYGMIVDNAQGIGVLGDLS